MKFPPKSKNHYILDSAQDKRIFKKLNVLARRVGKKDSRLLTFLYSQLEKDWATPLENFVDGLLKKK
jgi:hypothetical protein